jgi:hypothetical protein
VSIIRLFKIIFDSFRVKKENADQCIKNINGVAAVHKMSCAYRMESEFLSSMMKAAKEQALGTNFDGKVIYDVADSAYEKIKSLSQFSGDKEEKSLIDFKKDFFIWEFIEIEMPRLFDNSYQKSADAKYAQYFFQRQKKISELKENIENSSLLAKIFCTYLARSNYPKKNAFEILPCELETLFDSERKNSTHLNCTKILDTIVKIQKFIQMSVNADDSPSNQLVQASQVEEQLVLKNEHRVWIALLTHIKAEDAVVFLSRQVPFSQDLLERYKDRWDWESLSNNESMPWSLELLECFKDRWVWEVLSNNQSIPWSRELLRRFEDRWAWGDWDEPTGLSNNDSLPWSPELLELFKDRWDWGRFRQPSWQSGLSMSQTLPWSLELLERFKDRWDWGCLSNNGTLPWSLELLECFEDKWAWERCNIWDDGEDAWDPENCGLSENRSLPWSIELLERFEERWDWRALSTNESLPWSMELLMRFKDRWNWPVLSKNRFLPWADLLMLFDVTRKYAGTTIPECYWQKWLNDPNTPRELLEQYENLWEWSIYPENDLRDIFIEASGLKEIDWLEWLDRFEDKWDWEELSQHTSLLWPISLLRNDENLESSLLLGLSHSESLTWPFEFIERIDNYFDKQSKDWESEDSSDAKLFWTIKTVIWDRLSRNKSLPWSQDLIEHFGDRWNWKSLSYNDSLPWSMKLLERFEDSWDWAGLSANLSLPWSMELLERFEDSWGWEWLSCNRSLSWSVELLERFKEHWNWRNLTTNTSLPESSLTEQDIDNIMQDIASVE